MVYKIKRLTKNKPNDILKYCILFLILVVYSCNNKHENECSKEKKIIYNKYSSDNKLIGYSLRKYVFNNDTIKENYISINMKGEILEKYHTTFLKKDSTLFIITKDKGVIIKNKYFTPTKKDSCNDVELKFNRYKLCYLGKVNFQNYANVYNVYYEEKGYDGNRFKIILDKDFTVIAKFDYTEIRYKEVKQRENNIQILKLLDKTSSNIEWF